MDDGLKTPRGHPDYNTYVKILRVFIFRTDKQIFLINTLLLHIPFLALTHRQNFRETNTLAARGLEELFFQLWFCVSFWFWQEIGFGFTYLCTQSINKVVVLCQFFSSGGKQFWCYACTQCTIRLCGCVSFLVVAGNRSQNENTFLQKNLIGWVTL